MNKRISFLLALLSVGSAHVQADVKMPAIFGDHMVLQQEMKIPVWGWADPGEKVTVTFGGQKADAAAGADGSWRADLPPLPPGTAPGVLVIAGKNTVTINDVLVGDVWICSGQSNMVYDLGGNHSFGGAANAATAVPAANDPQLRFFVVQQQTGVEPKTDVVGKWEVCTPDSAALFSAVGYFFGQELRRTLNRPIGLIDTASSGTPAQAWTSLSGMEKDPPFAKYVHEHQGEVSDYAVNAKNYPAALAAYPDKLKQWNETVAPIYDPILKQWQDAVSQAQTSGQPLPPKPAPSTPMPQPPGSPDPRPVESTALYNGMIAPLIPYAIKGVIWYQGESNASNALEYQTLFPRMISDWREKWNQGDFPFLFVQLAGFALPQIQPSEGGWAYLREAQLKTLALPNTGMAVTIDIGDPGYHPRDKLDVGLRLALAARHVAYGQKLVYSGPIYDAMTVEGNKIRLTFKDTGSGLQISAPPWPPTTAPAPTELTGFAIAGADQKWVWAKARIDGNAVVVSSDQVASPVAVRYGWASDPPCNLYNKEGLPASPFRTDNWP